MTLEDLRAMTAGSPFIAFLQAQVASWDAETQKLVMTMPLRPELERITGTGQLHGGAIASLLDTAATFAIIAATGRPAPTVDIRVDYLRPAMGALRAEAEVLRIGRSIASADVRCFGEDSRVVALARATFVP